MNKSNFMSIRVKKITVLIKRSGPDTITFDVDLPPRFPKLPDDQPYMRLETEHNFAIEYIKLVFDREPDMIVDEEKGVIKDG